MCEVASGNMAVAISMSYQGVKCMNYICKKLRRAAVYSKFSIHLSYHLFSASGLQNASIDIIIS